MLVSPRFCIAAIIASGIACAQNDKKFTARELFYSPVTEAKPAPAAAKPAAPKPAQTAQKERTQPPKIYAEPAQTVSQAKTRPEAPKQVTSEAGVTIQRVSTGTDVAGP